VFFTYILYSNSLNKYYIGSTNNISRRLEEHNSRHTKSTRNGIPWHLVFVKTFGNHSEALKFEKMIKRQKSRKFIEELISSNKNEISQFLTVARPVKTGRS